MYRLLYMCKTLVGKYFISVTLLRFFYSHSKLFHGPPISISISALDPCFRSAEYTLKATLTNYVAKLYSSMRQFTLATSCS